MPTYDAVLFTPPAPVARVTLRRSGTSTTIEQVPMLVDSGADVTLVPKMFIETIGVSATEESSYELMGFDGTKSKAPAVELDLVFEKRAFVGRFLVIDR